MEAIQGSTVDPAAASLHILLVDANQQSRQQIEALLNTCNYRVTACKTGQEAIQVLKAQQGPGGTANFDLIIKEHCPSSGTNATRFLRRAQTEPLMQGIPVIVASAAEDRDVMVNCLQLGAADFMLKPLRASELRNLWARVYWWRRATYHHPAAIKSDPISQNDSRSGSGSHETFALSTEPQEAALDEGGSGGGHALGTTDNNGGSLALSKDSKTARCWSRTKLTAGTGNTPLTQQCSNNPSVQGTVAPKAEAERRPAKMDAPKFSQLSTEFPPLDLQGNLVKPKAAQAHTAACNGHSPTPGFRAYVAADHQQGVLKRALPDLSSRDDPGSSGSDWTGSLEKTERNKRQAITNSQEQNASNLISGLSALTQAWLQGQQNAANLTQRAQSLPTMGPVRSQAVAPSNLSDNKHSDPAKSQSMPPGFPFCFVPGMMPPMPPAFWNQSANPKTAFPHLSTPQQPGSEQGKQQQAQQQAMHNQIMYHHNLLLQQYGIVPPFMPFSAFANAASQAPPQEASKQSNGPVVPVPVVAKRHKSQAILPNGSSQMLLSTRSNTHNGNLTSTHLPTASPSRGVQQPLPTGGESTQDTAQRTNTSGQVVLDGFMMEPSRKQRRAEALHKYKQKRKNLNFTKKIRYESRKQLAQARPRVKGQFVRITTDDVDAVVDSLTPAQMKEVAEGTTDVADLLMENAKQDANTIGNVRDIDLKGEETKDVEISDEDETITVNGEEDDVSSPSSKDCQKAGFNAENNMLSPDKPILMDKSRRNSSQSGSNSPETEANLIEACV